MNLERVPVGVDEPAERPLIPGLRAGQQKALIHVLCCMVVFVVAANPELPSLVLVAPLRRPVEEPVVGHQELDPATGRRVRLVHDPVLKRECGESEQLGQVAVDVGAGDLGIAQRDRRQLVET